MRFVSTRGGDERVSFGTAVSRGLAPDGGLYVPESLPPADTGALTPTALAMDLAPRLLQPFAAGDALEASLAAMAGEAFDFPMPVVDVEDAPGPLSVLELYHGPTAAFKDVGARFLAAALQRRPRDESRRFTILVATSGDTGGAVAAAFHGRPGMDVVVLYPRGLVSARQEQQLACWGGNVRTLSVAGTFDDCQRLAKEAFGDKRVERAVQLSSANSINVGRLLPQMVYYAAASLALAGRDGRPPNFIVPTGNLGNALACVWAREMGLPIGEIVLACNANRTVAEYLASGVWQPRPSMATLASAMDVGNPSNLERLRWFDPERSRLRPPLEAVSVGDAEIRDTIRQDYRSLGRVWCPHTATAACAYRRLPAARRNGRWVIVATAHAAKFNDIVEPLIGAELAVPPALAALLSLPRVQRDMPARSEDLREILLEHQ